MGARGVASGLVGLVLLAGGAVVADRVAAHSAADVAVRELRSNFDGVVGEPTVTIGGFPFLTQLLAGRLTDVSGQVDGLTFQDLAVTDVDVDAQGVTTTAPYTAHRVVLGATLPVQSVQQLIAGKVEADVQLSVDGGRLVAHTKVLGLPVTPIVVPRVASGALRVDVADVTLGGLAIDVSRLPGGLVTRLRDLTIPVDGLPKGVALESVAVLDAGVRITAIGTDVVLPAAATGPTP